MWPHSYGLHYAIFAFIEQKLKELITQITPISLLFCPVGYCILISVFLGQPHIATKRENSVRSLELIYSHKNVDFVFVFLYTISLSPFLSRIFLIFVSLILLGFVCLLLQREIQLTSKTGPTAVVACIVWVSPAELMKAEFHVFCGSGSWPAIKINAIFYSY